MSTPSDTPIHPGTMLDRYRIVRQLGEGGMGAVYEAVHDGLGKRVAVKTLKPALATLAEARIRFLREGRAACRIHHPHVVEVFDVGEHQGVPFLVMEYLDGEDLARYIGRRGALEASEVADLMLPILAAVASTHDAGVIHRDLKPENIFLARARHGATQPKILDFGISRVPDAEIARLTRGSALVGTPAYMAPEQVRGGIQADPRSDQYALGAILYECLTGSPPFYADDLFPLLQAISDGAYRPLRALRPAVPEALAAVVARAMALDAAQRYPSVHALGQALLPYASPGRRSLWREVFGNLPTPEAALTLPNVVVHLPFTLSGDTLHDTAIDLDVRDSSVVTLAQHPQVTPVTVVPQRRRTLLIALGAAAVLALAGVAFAPWHRAPPPVLRDPHASLPTLAAPVLPVAPVPAPALPTTPTGTPTVTPTAPSAPPPPAAVTHPVAVPAVHPPTAHPPTAHPPTAHPPVRRGPRAPGTPRCGTVGPDGTLVICD